MASRPCSHGANAADIEKLASPSYEALNPVAPAPAPIPAPAQVQINCCNHTIKSAEPPNSETEQAPCVTCGEPKITSSSGAVSVWMTWSVTTGLLIWLLVLLYNTKEAIDGQPGKISVVTTTQFVAMPTGTSVPG
ncbi:hypothetical protein B0A48_10098 [Cryoendolithus antarcticus]|uniref:Uncharacterized protein n=1 Tax=Cryoendolithus antarcticus TaxID=1507870 RepID=A0A1V8SW83_9PEZI|nr:hypothetical protein B0A48_10098 [Cryoendolithus antarcticus]